MATEVRGTSGERDRSLAVQRRPFLDVRPLTRPLVGRPATGALWVAAALMVVSGIVHLHLWDVAYRDVATLGPLFLVQGIGTLVVAVALAVLRRGLLVVVALGLMLGTIIGFVLVLTVGLFGFTLHFVSGLAVLAVCVEGAAVVALATAGWLSWSATRPR